MNNCRSKQTLQIYLDDLINKMVDEVNKQSKSVFVNTKIYPDSDDVNFGKNSVELVADVVAHILSLGSDTFISETLPQYISELLDPQIIAFISQDEAIRLFNVSCETIQEHESSGQLNASEMKGLITYRWDQVRAIFGSKKAEQSHDRKSKDKGLKISQANFSSGMIPKIELSMIDEAITKHIISTHQSLKNKNLPVEDLYFFPFVSEKKATKLSGLPPEALKKWSEDLNIYSCDDGTRRIYFWPHLKAAINKK